MQPLHMDVVLQGCIYLYSIGPQAEGDRCHTVYFLSASSI